jgi:16S rRNA (adenine1518-N6/adenine1519-N6)-dimethyltransferase
VLQLNFTGKTVLAELLKPDLFDPAPKVDSQILILARRQQKLFDVDEKAFFRLVKAGFSQRRKTLINSLSAGLHMSKDEVKTVCLKANIEPNNRPQTLSLDDWHKLFQAINT